MLAKGVRDLEVYKTAFEMQQVIFVLSKSFPKEERYALTDQVRRSSRSVGANVSEAWAKRRYPSHFVSKLTDADGEVEETIHWIETAFACEYIGLDAKEDLIARYQHVSGMLHKMMSNPDAWCKGFVQG